MGLDFFKHFRQERAEKNTKKPILPTDYMIKIRGTDDLETNHILQSLTQDHPVDISRDEMHVQENDSDKGPLTIYFSVYGFEVFANTLKQDIIYHRPVDDARTQYFKDITVGMSIIANQYATKTGQDDDGKETTQHPFQGSETRENYDAVSLRADFLSATYFLYQWMFFNYDEDSMADIDIERTYDYLVELAKNLRTDYNRGYHKAHDKDIAVRNLPTIPSLDDFEKQKRDAVYIPSLNDTEEEADTDTPNEQTNPDSSLHDNSHPTDDDNQDPVESLTNNSNSDHPTAGTPADDSATKADSANQDTPKDVDDTEQRPPDDSTATDGPTSTKSEENETSSPDTKDEDRDDSSHDRAKTVGELRREQDRSSDDTGTSTKENTDGDTSQDESPEAVIKRMYAPKIYQMNIHFPQFSVDNDMDEPPNLEEAVKHNDFDNQLYIVQENNHIKKQANGYLQNEAQQLNRNFNYEMGHLVMRTYQQMSDRIHAIMQEGRDNQELDQAAQRYYDKQAKAATQELEKHRDQALDRRLDALKQEYKQKRQDILAQADQRYQSDRTHIKTQIQSDTARIRNDNAVRRDQDLAQRVQDTKAQLEENLNQLLQSKADKYKDMADQLGQRLFTALQNHIDANYPKLVNHVSILMNDQIQFNYSHKRLDDSNANVVKKRLGNYERQLKQTRQEHENTVNDYEDRIQMLQKRLDQRNDTSRGYDKLLAEKNDLQDRLGHAGQRADDQQKKIDKLKQQLDDAPLGQPDMTAKSRSIQLENQSLKEKYRHLEDVNNESHDRINELTQELENKKHFWNRK